MLRTASSLPLAGLLTLGFDPTRFQMKPPACYRTTWQLPEPDSHRQATTSLRTANHLQRQPPAPLDARKIEANASAAPISPARATKARMSFDRQPPPKPNPGFKYFRPIRAS